MKMPTFDYNKIETYQHCKILLCRLSSVVTY